MTRPGVTAYDVADHYDRAYFDDLVARYRTRNRFARQRIKNVFLLLPRELKGKTLVDIGCGMVAARTDVPAGALPGSLDPFIAALDRVVPAGLGRWHAEPKDAAPWNCYSTGRLPPA